MLATPRSGPRIVFDRTGLRLGASEILRDVSFEVAPGTIHCVIGPNGGGKTSLIRSLLGQMPHTGEIRIEWDRGQRIGYVPQVLEFDRQLPVTVDDFMAIVSQDRMAILGIARSKRRAVDEALERVGMTAKRRRKMGELSGGERQRVLFAQALIPPPDLLVLDEPLAGIDAAGAAIIGAQVARLRDLGTTILWIHHDLAEVRRMADAVTCIERTVMFSGPPARVLGSVPAFDSEYVRFAARAAGR